MKCECFDNQCPAHRAQSSACTTLKRATVTLYRIDMEDRCGTPMCEDCAQDALESGLFTDLSHDCNDECDEEVNQ